MTTALLLGTMVWLSSITLATGHRRRATRSATCARTRRPATSGASISSRFARAVPVDKTDPHPAVSGGALVGVSLCLHGGVWAALTRAIRPDQGAWPILCLD